MAFTNQIKQDAEEGTEILSGIYLVLLFRNGSPLAPFKKKLQVSEDVEILRKQLNLRKMYVEDN